MSRVMGIDCGASGALVWLDPDGTGRWEMMPAVPKVGLQLGAIRDLLEADRPTFVVLERAQAMPGQGVSSMFAYGTGYGGLQGVLTALRIPFETVPPATWHKDLCGVRRSEGRAEAKARALQVVEQRLPRFELPKTKAKREAVVDAACLALWGRRHAPSFTDEAPRIPALALASSER